MSIIAKVCTIPVVAYELTTVDNFYKSLMLANSMYPLLLEKIEVPGVSYKQIPSENDLNIINIAVYLQNEDEYPEYYRVADIREIQDNERRFLFTMFSCLRLRLHTSSDRWRSLQSTVSISPRARQLIRWELRMTIGTLKYLCLRENVAPSNAELIEKKGIRIVESGALKGGVLSVYVYNTHKYLRALKEEICKETYQME